MKLIKISLIYPNLKNLDVSNNQIMLFYDLHFRNLSSLNLSSNLITYLDKVPSLNSLEYLNLNDNPISNESITNWGPILYSLNQTVFLIFSENDFNLIEEAAQEESSIEEMQKSLPSALGSNDYKKETEFSRLIISLYKIHFNFHEIETFVYELMDKNIEKLKLKLNFSLL